MGEHAPRERTIEAASRLFSRQGYAPTTMRAIVAAARAPWGSTHHYFPGGKQQVGAEAVRFGALRVQGAIDHCVASTSSPGEAVERYFALAGEVLEASDWTEGCPVGTVALETSVTPGPVAAACGAAFRGWEAAWSAAFADAGVSPARAAELATIVVSNVEGALLLGRVGRSLQPVRLAGRTVRALVDAEPTFRVERADAEPGATLLREFLGELEDRYGPPDPGAPEGPTATPDELAAPHGTFLVARLDGEPVGCGGCKRLRGPDHPDGPIAEIKRMYVRPAARGRGVARALLAALERAAADLGHRRVRLDTGPKQPDARHVYRTSGYREIADYNGNPRAAHWFEKDLEGPTG